LFNIIVPQKRGRGKDYLPDPLYSYEEWEKANNFDIAELDPLEIRQEELYANLALLRPDLKKILFVNDRGRPIIVGEWLLDRLAVIKEAKQIRRRERAV